MLSTGQTTRRRLLGALAAAAMAVGLAACGSSHADTAGSVKYGGQSIIPDLVFRAQDWGEEHGVEIEQTRFPSGSEAFEALLSGEVGVSNGGSGRLITIASQRPDSISLVAKWQYGGSRYSVLVPKGSEITSAEQLEGKTVAIDNGSGSYSLFLVWLDQHGLSLDDINVIQTKVSDIGAALQAGSADVGVAWEPTASLLTTMDLADRIDTLDSAGESPNFLIVNKEWAEANREDVVAFLKAAVDVGQLVQEDPQTAGQMAADVAATEGVEANAEALGESLTYIKMEPQIDQAALDELAYLAQEMVEDRTIEEVPDFESLVDNSYLEEALGQS